MIVYIAGAYRARTIFGVARNIYRAWKLAQWLIHAGFAPACPHTNTAFMSEFGDRVTHEQCIEADKEILSRCNALLTLPGYRWSNGARIEVAFARRHRIPVFHEVDRLVNWAARGGAGPGKARQCVAGPGKAQQGNARRGELK